MIAEKADIGIAWDGDADRCFFIDGTGEFIAGDFVTALLAESFLMKHPGDEDRLRRPGQLCGQGHHRKVRRHGADEPASATPSSSGACATKRAIFGGEVTGHYYFRDNFYADNGFIPALLILELMSRKGQTLAELLAPLREKYFISGEINTKVSDMAIVPRKLDELARALLRGGRRPIRSTASPRSSRTGTSTSAARTPSRCCG